MPIEIGKDFTCSVCKFYKRRALECKNDCDIDDLRADRHIGYGFCHYLKRLSNYGKIEYINADNWCVYFTQKSVSNAKSGREAQNGIHRQEETET